MASRDEDNKLDKTYKKQKISDFYYGDFVFFHKIIQKFLVVKCRITLDIHFMKEGSYDILFDHFW